jgi:hypothetical protein
MANETMERVSNEMYLSAIMANGTRADQQILPDPTQNGVGDLMQSLYSDPMYTQPSQGAWDTFSGLFGRWATQIAIHSYQWNSPFEAFVEPLMNGRGKELVALETPEMDAYDAHRSQMLFRDFGTPHTKFIPMDFEVSKSISISETNIRTAILEPGQLSTYTNAQVDTLINADKIATYTAMKKHLSDGMAQPGFANLNINIADPANPTPEELRLLSQRIRYMADMLTIKPSARYNVEGVTTISQPNELVLFITPTISTSLTVNVLADAFNRADVALQPRLVTVDEMPIKDAWCCLADVKYLREARQIRTIQGMPYDPSTQSFNLTLVHRSAMGFDPFVNAVAFSGSPTTVREEVTVQPDTSVSAKIVKQNGQAVTQYDPAKSRMPLHLVIEGSGGSVTPDDVFFRLPQGHRVTVTADKPDVLNSKTYVDTFDVIHLQKGLPKGIKLTFNVTSFANEQNKTIAEAKAYKPLTASCTLEITDIAASAATSAREDEETEE